MRGSQSAIRQLWIPELIGARMPCQHEPRMPQLDWVYDHHPLRVQRLFAHDGWLTLECKNLRQDQQGTSPVESAAREQRGGKGGVCRCSCRDAGAQV